MIVDERYIRNRLAIITDAIAMAETTSEWTDVSEAISVPLPENTSREIVDTSSEREIEINKAAKLFEGVKYGVADQWMRLAGSLYHQMLADGSDVDNVVATLNFEDESDSARMRESVVAVAAVRSKIDPVVRRVTLRGADNSLLEQDLSDELRTQIEGVTESLSDKLERKSYIATMNKHDESQAFDDTDFDDAFDDSVYVSDEEYASTWGDHEANYADAELPADLFLEETASVVNVRSSTDEDTKTTAPTQPTPPDVTPEPPKLPDNFPFAEWPSARKIRNEYSAITSVERGFYNYLSHGSCESEC